MDTLKRKFDPSPREIYLQFSKSYMRINGRYRLLGMFNLLEAKPVTENIYSVEVLLKSIRDCVNDTELGNLYAIIGTWDLGSGFWEISFVFLFFFHG